MAEAIVAEGRRTYPLCPSPFGCDYCDHFGCPTAMCELFESDPDRWDLRIETHDGAVRYFIREQH